MADREKSPREVRKFTMNFTNKISQGALVSSYQVYASRQSIEITTLAAQVNPEDPTVLLNDDPKFGALLIVHPGDLDLEEIFKVTSVTPSGPDFLCGILPSAERQHAIATTVNYEPGENARMLLDDTPTPAGTIGELAIVSVKEGADGKNYRVNAEAICNNGEIREDEITFLVVEFLPTETVDKQPADTVDVVIGFDDWTDKYSTTVLTATAFVARNFPQATTVNGVNLAGVTTINLNAHPGVGALLTVNTGQLTQEKLLVASVSGSGPYACTVSPLQFTHTGPAEPVSYLPGVSTRVLVSTNGIVTSPEAIFRLRRAAAGQTYLWVVLATLADGQVAQKSVTVAVEEA